jgi:tetratricopeptide (TPR) repeat protein
MSVLHLALSQPLPDATTEVFRVTADAIASQLAVLALHWHEFDEAKRYWDAALVLNPNNTLALVGLGGYEKRTGRFDEAQPYYEKALALEPQNAYAELDYAEYFLDRGTVGKDPGENTTDLTEARRHFARSFKLDPQNPETLAMNGASYLRPGESLDKALESLTEAHAMLPSQSQITFLLARAYVLSGNPTKAEPLLRAIVAWGQPGTADEANTLLQHIERPAAE